MMRLPIAKIAAFILLWNFNVAEAQQTIAAAVKALSDDLMKNYNKHMVPMDIEPTIIYPFPVSIHIDLLTLGEIDELEEKLSSVFWIMYNWTDASIHWDMNQTNITWIVLGYDDVWTPKLRLRNPHSDIAKSQSVDHSYDVVIYGSTGIAYYDEMMTTRTTCDLDMTYYPFDVQSCTVELIMLGATKFPFKLDVSGHELFSEEDASHGSWRLLNRSLTENYGEVDIRLIFERKPLFLLINILLPIIVLALLTPVVFILPKKSGERVGYAITMLLAISVYMTIVSDNLPKNSEPMPLISIMIFILYVLDAVIVFVVIINTKIHTMKNHNRLPCLARNFVIITQKLSFLITCQTCKNETLDGSADEQEYCIEMEGRNNSDKEMNTKKDVKSLELEHMDLTWQDVSKCIDRWSFIITYLFKILIPIIFLTIAKSKGGYEEL